MRKRYGTRILVALLPAVLLAIASCRGGGTANVIHDTQDIAVRHAGLLTLREGGGFVLAEIKNPWDTTKVLHRYVLVPKETEVPAGLPEGELIRTPLSNMVLCTSVHAALVDELGAYAAIGGVCDKEYMYIDKLQADIRSGKVTDCGSSLTPDIERIVDMDADAILVSPFENSGTYGKLGKIGIPIIECADYMETGALGRAEWMRFYGLLTGRSVTADSLFERIESDYMGMKKMVGSVEERPTVIDGKRFGSSWYVAGANSTVGRMIEDAGGRYVFADEMATGSVPYDPEVVFNRGQDARIWMLKYRQETSLTYTQLAQEWAGYAAMGAFKRRNVYACNLMKVAFYEETPFHPDRLLRDFIKVFHPDILKDHKLRYFIKIEE